MAIVKEAGFERIDIKSISHPIEKISGSGYDKMADIINKKIQDRVEEQNQIINSKVKIKI